MKLAMIAAMAENRVIGRNNQLPWRIPSDLQFFKRVTLGKPVVMGRNTFESIGRPLPGRTNIVITRNLDYSAEGVVVAHSVEEGIERAKQIAERDGIDEVMVIGGGELYAALLPLAQRLYITEVVAEFEGDAWFPEIDASEWGREVSEEHPQDDQNEYPYRFVILNRV